MANENIAQERIAKNLRTLRDNSGLTQEALAGRLNLSAKCYANYEQGKRNVPIYVLASASSFFKVALESLVKIDLKKVDLKGLRQLGRHEVLLAVSDSHNYNIQNIYLKV